MTPRSIKIAALAGVLTLAGGFGAFYAGQGRAGNAGACSAARATAERLKPLARGEVAAAQVHATPKPMPDLAFTGPQGEPATLASFRGRTVLLNLWATWCVPCRHEMPALDRLQSALGGADFEVVAINIDTRNLDKPRAWLAEHKIERLAYYADPQAKVFQDLRAAGKAVGLPTTLLIDGEGCELALLHGQADWGGADAKAFVGAALGR